MDHAVPDSVAVHERFAGALTPGVEYHAIVELEKGGAFEVVLFPDVAPNHVASFVSLARKGYYDGTTFHRVLENFMAQGGDPTGTGGGDPGYSLPAEFSPIPFDRAILGAARGPHSIHSAGSQFFVMLVRAPSLDGQYTVFGKAVRGMEVVDGIRRRDPDERPNYAGDAIRTVRIVEVRSSSAPPAPASEDRPDSE